MLGLTAKPAATITSVCPSAGARATISQPITLLAPERLSTTKGWPSLAESLSATMRPSTSSVPPGAKGTTKRTGRSGYAALASVAASSEQQRAKRTVRPHIALLLAIFPAGELRLVPRDLRPVEIPREAFAHVRRRALQHRIRQAGELS